MNWQRNFGNWVSRDRQQPRSRWMITPTGLDYNPAANVTSNPEVGTDAHGRRNGTHKGWKFRAYNYRKQGTHVHTPDWVAVEIFLPTETPKFLISPFVRRALIRVLGRFKSADKQLNKTFDLFAGDEASDRFGHALLQPQIVHWLLNDPRMRGVNLAFQTIVLWEGKDGVPFTQRQGALIVEMPGRVEDQGAMGFLADVGADFLAGIPAQLWQGQPPSGRAGR